ncbi:hypothetical protein [Streptomyces inhibens]|uniref:hypothetical protein n=1 Tax=Streptomyces inhibens TaxID=2293571 RepID=UPI001EE6D0E0|nr:hypothetical protein [Streptomyces inhibens]UKY51094.1 hypothetical protein KI385_21240 [Streptomyces inhibens]
MNEAWEVLIFIGMILLMAAIFGLCIWAWRSGNKRDGRSSQQWEELIQFVEARGWSHTAWVPGAGDRYCGGDPLPMKGTNIPIRDHIVGEFRGRPISCFEYTSRDMNADGPDSVLYSAVFAVTMPTPVPRMVIKKPRAVDKVNARADALFGGGKVMELGDPAFDEAFRLIANDEEFARSALTGSMAQFLTSDPRAKGQPLRFQENLLLTWHRGRLRAEEIEQKLNYLCDVLDRLPAQA